MKAIISSIVGGLGVVLCMLYHEQLSDYLVDAQLSWTFSYLLPYMLTVSFILFFCVAFIQLIRLSRAYKKLIFIGSFAGLCGIGFAFHPIYQGDLTNNAEEIALYANDNLLPEGMSMIALPGCQFCYGQLPTLKKLRARNPTMHMTVLFVLPDSLAMEDYQEQLGGSIDVISSATPQLLSDLVGGKYPTFVYFKPGEQQFTKWSMDGLGAVGLDFLEELNH
jgi:hypothetical protein